MSSRTVQKLVAAQRASPFRTRHLHSLPSSGTSSPLQRLLFSHKVDTSEKATSEKNASSFNLWAQVREARPAVRYTVYAGLGLMATVESTFWFTVIKAKFFPAARAEDREKAEDFLKDFRAAVKGYRAVWMRNYGRYYGAYTWGLGYGGLDALDTAESSSSLGLKDEVV